MTKSKIISFVCMECPSLIFKAYPYFTILRRFFARPKFILVLLNYAIWILWGSKQFCTDVIRVTLKKYENKLRLSCYFMRFNKSDVTLYYLNQPASFFLVICSKNNKEARGVACVVFHNRPAKLYLFFSS